MDWAEFSARWADAMTDGAGEGTSMDRIDRMDRIRKALEQAVRVAADADASRGPKLLREM